MQSMCVLYVCVLPHSEQATVFKKGKDLEYLWKVTGFFYLTVELRHSNSFLALFRLLP